MDIMDRLARMLHPPKIEEAPTVEPLEFTPKPTPVISTYQMAFAIMQPPALCTAEQDALAA